MVWGIFIDPCSRHRSQFWNIFVTSGWNCTPFSSQPLPVAPPPSRVPKQPSSLSLLLRLLQEGLAWRTVFRGWLLSRSVMSSSFVHVVLCVESASLVSVDKYYSIWWTYHILSLHSLVGGHSDYFHLLAIAGNAVLNMCALLIFSVVFVSLSLISALIICIISFLLLALFSLQCLFQCRKVEG